MDKKIPGCQTTQKPMRFGHPSLTRPNSFTTNLTQVYYIFLESAFSALAIYHELFCKSFWKQLYTCVSMGKIVIFNFTPSHYYYLDFYETCIKWKFNMLSTKKYFHICPMTYSFCSGYDLSKLYLNFSKFKFKKNDYFFRSWLNRHYITVLQIWDISCSFWMASDILFLFFIDYPNNFLLIFRLNFRQFFLKLQF